MRLYYLTGLHHGLSNLALRRVKISRFSDLNDPFELLAVDLEDRRHRKAFREMKEALNETKGLICLSKSWDNPLLWGHYAEKHTGLALGFDVSDALVAKVIYAQKPEVIPIDTKTDRPVLTEELVNRLLRTKFYDWRYEQEMRLFVDLDHETRESGMYFYDFSSEFALREVILGPRCEVPIENVRTVVKGYSPSVSVTQARIAFSSFRVVENRSVTRG
jgi:hypothetical protein